ncbi:NUDIX domain-containing protein [Kineococcus sp. R8]|uniref:NUDIX hydrolase n=1 Tax=Kineococcus siccus TaxID=2696567 RepID=UPI0014134446|nr:NUDIX domain-containing protein [Kineococcus siccus]NAZ80727.1 NUDIX domain-containing protein [Kineococcus siccus]
MNGTSQAILVAVSTVIFALLPDRDGRVRVHLPLVRRTRDPFGGQWALPGGWVRTDESLSDAGRRTLAETTGLRPSYLEQLYTFGRTDRSPGQRVVSVVYSALVRNHEAAAAVEGENVRWTAADDCTGLAFDHDEIVRYALTRLRSKVQHAHVALHFLGERFSLAQLREVHEAILQRPLDPANFRRQIEGSGTIAPTGERLTGGRHRPPRLYRALVAAGSTGPFQDVGPLA